MLKLRKEGDHLLYKSRSKKEFKFAAVDGYQEQCWRLRDTKETPQQLLFRRRRPHARSVKPICVSNSFVVRYRLFACFVDCLLSRHDPAPTPQSLFDVTVLLVIGTLLYTNGSRAGSSSIHDFVLVKVNCRTISMGHAKTATNVWSS
jgi:hypothetical protein